MMLSTFSLNASFEKPLPIIPNLNTEIKFDNSIKLNLFEENTDVEVELFQFPDVDALLNNLQKEKMADNTAMVVDGDAMEDVWALEQEYAGNPKVQKAEEVFGAITENKLLQKLLGGELIELPVGIRKTIGNNTYTLAISEVIAHPNYIECTAYLKAELTNDRVLWFGTDNLKFTSEGGIVGDATLGLFADFPMTRGSRKVAVVLKEFIRDENEGNHGGTYVTVDCDGFVEMRVDADLIISREWLLPTDTNGKPLSGDVRVTSNFGITMTDWDDLVTDISLPHFTLTKSPKTAFLVDLAVLDLSDLKNAPGFVPPPEPPSEPIIFDSSDENSVATSGGGMVALDFGGENTDDSETDEETASALWRGVYFKQIEVVLPPIFSQKPASTEEDSETEDDDTTDDDTTDDDTNDDETTDDDTNEDEDSEEEQNNLPRIKVGAKELYIQSEGVTAEFYIADAIPYDKGKMDAKWKYSVDYLSVDVFYNKVTGFSFKGRLGVPIADETRGFKYFGAGNIEEDIYNFGVALESDMEFPLLKTSKVTLHSGTAIYVDVIQGKFKPSASITATLDINATSKKDEDEDGNTDDDDDENEDEDKEGKTLEIADCYIEKLILTTEAPYIGLATGGSITLTTGAALNNSFLQVNSVMIAKKSDTQVKLSLSFSTSVMSDDDGGSGTGSGASLGIVGNLEDSDDSHKWVYGGLEVDAIFIDISIGSHVRINGEIRAFSEDPIYGNGFKGSLAGGFIQSGDSYKFTMAANFMTGTKPDEITGEDFKYWLFDVFISSETWSVPLFAGLEANGFGGGAYHHMSMASYDLAAMADDPTNPYSGIIYEPDKGTRLGVKASIGLTSTGGSFEGNATLELVFGYGANNQGIVLNEIFFYGSGEFVKQDLETGNSARMDQVSLDKPDAEALDKAAAEKPEQDKIKCALMIQLNFVGGFEMHGQFAAYLTASEGKITGDGVVDLYASTHTNKWHIYIGGYTDNSILDPNGDELPPVSANLDYGSFKIDVGMYMLTGNDLPGAPGIHPQAAAYFDIPLNSDNRDGLLEGGRSPASGTGFAFGAYAVFNTNAKNGQCNSCLVGCKKDKYVNFNGGGGFDISLLKYALETSCSQSGHSPHGMKGWRAGGRLWFFFEIGGGRTSFLSQCINLPNFNAGILMDADVTNPSYFRALIKLNVLNLDFETITEIGEQCGIVVEN